MRLLATALALLISVSGCSSLKDVEAPESLSKEASLGARTPTEDLLRSLGAASRVITLSVYDFKDYTGQNKPGETAQYSRAVTQGGVSILKKALLDAGNHRWFRVLERGALENLLQERKIIRSIRQQYKTSDGRTLPPLGPLLYSGLLLEGGIIAYESNLVTGGAGARYLGIGASAQYRRDMVTVYLRAVSVTTGEVLVSVNTSKTIYSTLVDGGIFKYVSFDKIVEGEAGFSFNEPPQLAVRQAIEMGVYALIMEGYAEGLWKFKDGSSGDDALRHYVEKYDNVSEKAQERVGAMSSSPAPAKVSYKPEVKSPARNTYASYGGQAITAQHSDTQTAVLKRTAAQPSSRSNYAPPAAPQPKARTTSNYTAVPDEIRNAREHVPNGWYVQVAAYKLSEQSKSAALTGQLKSAGFPVFVQKTSVHAIPYHRILVGPYPDQPVANDNKSRVQAIAGPQSEPYVKQIYREMW
ncbi:MAG: SPOR domain-containing protein [Bdellovibrionales bacterium]|nr:SPOR domain-containing protein [Bdellovibrionales bacterium]